jgi:hypothetical protein
MSPAQADVFNIIETHTHLWNNQWVGRDFKNYFATYYSLEVNNRSYCKIEVITPSADDGISTYNVVIVGSKVVRDFFPCTYIVKTPIGWRTPNKTIVFVIWARLLIGYGPKELTTFTASLSTETNLIK